MSIQTMALEMVMDGVRAETPTASGRRFASRDAFALLVMGAVTACGAWLLSRPGPVELRWTIWISLIQPFVLAAYWALVLAAGLWYASWYRLERSGVLAAATLMGVGIQIACYWVEFTQQLAHASPFGAPARAYEWYARGYGSVLGIAWGLLAGSVIRWLWRVRVSAAAIWWLPAAAVTALALSRWAAARDVPAVLAWAVGAALGLSQALDVGALRQRLREGLRRRPWLIPLGLWALAAVVRVAWGWRILQLTGAEFLIASDDGQTYHAYALKLLHGEPVGERVLYWGGHGYWFFLSLVYRCFGESNFLAAIIAQSCLGGLVPVITYTIGRRVFSRSVGVIAGLLTALNVNLIFLSSVLGMEAVFIPLVFAAWWMLITAVQRGWITRVWAAATVGVLWGLANTARPEVFLFPVAIAAILMWRFRRSAPRGRVLRMGVAVLCGAGLILAAHSAWNLRHAGRFTFLRSGVLEGWEGGEGAWESAALTDMGVSPFRDPAKAWRILEEQPGPVLHLFARSFAKKGLRFLFRPNFGAFDPLLLVNAHVMTNRYAVYVAAYMALGIGLGLWWAFRRLARCRTEVLLLAAYALYTFGLYAVVRAFNARHLGVIQPILYLFGAYGLSEWWRRAIAAGRSQGVIP